MGDHNEIFVTTHRTHFDLQMLSFYIVFIPAISVLTGTARVYNAASRKCLAKLEGHDGEISKVSCVMHVCSVKSNSLSPHGL